MIQLCKALATGPAATHARRNAEIDVQETILEASRRCEEGCHGEAFAVLTRALSSFPSNRKLLYAQACTLFAWERKREAHRMFMALHQGGFQQEGLLTMLGWTSLASADYAAAEAYMRQAVDASPGDWESHYGLGVVLRMRDAHAATAAFASALTARPDSIPCLVSLSACALDRRDASLAEHYARRALQVSDASSSAWTNLGMALSMQDRPTEAVEAFRSSERYADPDDEDQDLNLGIALRLLGKTREAIEYFEERLPQHPSVAAAGHYALALLTDGRFREGWAQYEFRWLQAPLNAQRARYDRPVWSGQDLAGKTILLRCEQGAGDVFQFIRYAPLLKSMGATVWLELRSGIGALAKAFRGIDRIYRPGERVADFDFYIDLLSLPGAFGTTLESIPVDVPYLHAPEAVRAQWGDRLAGGTELTVGLAWAGDPNHARDRQRSIPISTIGPLASLQGTRWFSLQKGSAADALRDSPLGRTIVDLDPNLYEYADTAAAIEAMDLVVTVDTSIAHLAGALGKPAWVLLPFAADWRWLQAREDSPWYPTMRLFRQRVADDWHEVVERVRAALLLELSDRRGGRGPDRSNPIAESQLAVAVEPTCHAGAPVPGLARACRTRVGMLQYIGSSESARSIAHYGEHLQPHVDVIARLVHKGNSLVEIGAGIGLHTIALASMVAPDGQLLAFEYSPILRRILRQNLTANEVRCVSVVKSTIVGEDANRLGGAETNASEPADLPRGAVTVDGLQLERLHLLKVTDPALVSDTLQGATDTLWRHRPVLFLAHEARATLTTQAARVRDFGYRCWCIESPLFHEANFNRRDDDIFPGESALAVLAIPEEVDSDVRIRELAGITTVTRL